MKNLAPQAGIRPPLEWANCGGCRQYFEVRRCDSAKVPKWVRADTVRNTPLLQDTFPFCDCRLGSGETVSREGTDARNAQGEML